MNKRRFSILLVLSLVLSMIPIPAKARADGVMNEATCIIYQTLQEAVNTTTGGTIKLLNNINESVTIDYGISFTLDLNGNTLNGGEDSAIKYNSSGRLTIKDSGTGGSITSAANRSSNGTIDIKDGIIEVESGIIENTCNDIDANAILKNHDVYGSVILRGGTLRSVSGTAIYIGGYPTSSVSQGLFVTSGSPIIMGGYRAVNVIPDLSEYTDVEIIASNNYDGSLPIYLKTLTDSSYRYLSFRKAPTPAPAQVTNLDLTGKLTGPVMGVSPMTSFDSDQYTATVTWSDSPTQFLSGTAYTANLSLVAKAGYTFLGVGQDTFTYSGASVTNNEGTADRLEVRVEFPATAERTLQGLTISNPPSKISYQYGETFSTTGMVVKAIYNDGTENENFTDYTVDKRGPLTLSDTLVTLTANNTNIKTTQLITISNVDVPTEPDVPTNPDKGGPSNSGSSGSAKTEGKIEKEQKRDENSPIASLNNSPDQLKSKLLSSLELEQVNAGKNAKVTLTIKDIRASVSDKEKDQIEEKLATELPFAIDIPLLYMDISLFKQIGDGAETKVTETNGKIGINLEVPEMMRSKENGLGRTYHVVRIHEGLVEILEGTYNPVTHIFTFETDRFSTYALTYQDMGITQPYHDFHHLQLQVKADKTSQTLSYKRIPNVDGYLIYGGRWGEEIKLLGEAAANTTNYTVNNLKQGGYYKYRVKAYRMVDGDKIIIITSKIACSVIEANNYANPIKLTTDIVSIDLGVGETYTVNCKIVLPKGKKEKENKAAIRYDSSNMAIATIDNKGRVQAIAKGSCYVYAYGQNGIFKRIKLTVE